MTNSYKDVLNKMIEEPGMISDAFSQFHNYSFGNLMMVAFECARRGIEFGPVSNYKNWQRLGRQVKPNGENHGGGIGILHPKQKSFPKDECKVCGRSEDDHDEVYEKSTGHEFAPVWVKYMTFELKNTAFVLCQTEGPDIEWEQFGWDKDAALKELEITEVTFNHGNGNCQGFANKDGVAVNPVAKYPLKTMVHEIAHKMLHITDDITIVDFLKMDYSENEVEAETVAMIVSQALGLPGRDESIGYIRHWMAEGFEYSDKMANKILSTVNKILKAGKVEATAEGTVEMMRHEVEYTHDEN